GAPPACRAAAGRSRHRRRAARRPARTRPAGGRLRRLLAVRAPRPRGGAAARLSQHSGPGDARHGLAADLPPAYLNLRRQLTLATGVLLALTMFVSDAAGLS